MFLVISTVENSVLFFGLIAEISWWSSDTSRDTTASSPTGMATYLVVQKFRITLYMKFKFPCSVWYIASVIGMDQLNCVVTSYLCAVSIILRINKRARHRSVNILAVQSSCGFHRLVIKNAMSSSWAFPFFRVEWIKCFVCWLFWRLSIISYRTSVRLFVPQTGTVSFEQISREPDGYSPAQKMPWILRSPGKVDKVLQLPATGISGAS